ncbi:MAG: GAF domain-containing protein [Catonella sp.]|uniref:GAF domain-containing protein n=1 Tax=Catonella sp. TaxID=2382125 RepID=UPI003F9FEA63
MTNYSLISKEIEALTSDVNNLIANLSNVSALLNMELTDINWVGFYLVKGDILILGPFQGKPACVTIPIGQGVCGTAVSTDSIQLVKNVHEFAGHIACDSASNSELVLPIHDTSGKVVAVLDIDSPSLGRFCEADKEGIALLTPILEKLFA